MLLFFFLALYFVCINIIKLKYYLIMIVVGFNNKWKLYSILIEFLYNSWTSHFVHWAWCSFWPFLGRLMFRHWKMMNCILWHIDWWTFTLFKHLENLSITYYIQWFIITIAKTESTEIKGKAYICGFNEKKKQNSRKSCTYKQAIRDP